MALTAAAVRRRGGSSWALVGATVALLVAGPLLVLPASFVGRGELLDPIARALLPDALRNSLLLAGGVALGTLLVGGGLAVLVSFYDFPGRGWLDWALVLPLAMPSYVLVFVALGQYGTASPLQSNLLGDGLRIGGLRGLSTAVIVLSAVLYPYVYALGRAAFLGQSRQSLEAARSLGKSHGQAIRQLAVPLARPALAGGVALAVMESLADFGTVDLLGVQALTSGIYRVWYSAFDQDAALQLATVLVGLTLTLVVLERMLRGRSRYHQALGRGDAVVPVRLSGWRGWLAAAPGWLLLTAVFFLPVAQLVAWATETIVDGTVAPSLGSAAGTSVLLASIAAVIAVVTATIVAYGQRARPSALGGAAARLATVGYAVPGTVVAVAVYVPLVWFDRRLAELGESALGADLGLLLTGSLAAVVLAYLVRFHALAYFAAEARMLRIDPALDDAARSLGADRARVLADVHLPLLWPGIVTAALLVMVEVMKELPATALLRPLGGDTLATTVWEATKDSRLDAAALPALVIVLVSLVPVIVLMRMLRRGDWSATQRA